MSHECRMRTYFRAAWAFHVREIGGARSPVIDEGTIFYCECDHSIPIVLEGPFAGFAGTSRGARSSAYIPLSPLELLALAADQ